MHKDPSFEKQLQERVHSQDPLQSVLPFTVYCVATLLLPESFVFCISVLSLSFASHWRWLSKANVSLHISITQVDIPA